VLLAACETTDIQDSARTPVAPQVTQVQMQPQNRLALVIGNAAYHQKDYFLENPVNDATDLAAVLRQLDFEVVEKTNLSKVEMEFAIDQFSHQLYQNKGVGLFYFSGHGIQHNGVNYLLPVDIQSLTDTWQLRHKTVSAQYILDGMQAATNQVNLLILDACRDLPVSIKSWAKGDMIPPGLSNVVPIPGSLIAYAAAPGDIAKSGAGQRNSPYVKHMMKWMQVPNLSIDEVFTKVGEAVKKETYGNQLPGYYKQLYQPFYFKRQAPKVSPEKSKFAQLLRACKTHFQAGRLSAAWGCYLAVLKKDQTNAQALAGLKKIEGRYVRLTLSALKKGQVNSARQYLASLRRVIPGAAQLPRLEAQLSALESQTVVTRPSEIAGKVFRDRLRDGGEGPSMVWIAGGRFKMGDIQGGGQSYEQPVHGVSVGRFAMSRTEVKVGEFRRFVNATWYRTEAEKGDGCYVDKNGKGSWEYVKDANWRNPNFSQNDNHPVVCISLHDATVYAEWLSQQTGKVYRLPTEAEWEYAARAETETARYWGNVPNEACRYANVHDRTSKKENGFSWTPHNCRDGYAKTAPVGSFKPNAFGLFDMLGNVWEWTCSKYEDKYGGEEKRCITNKKLAKNTRLSLRGGGWIDWPGNVRSADRNWGSPVGRYGFVGLRLVRP
jgi:formylglycine-generating enzyme required for sulfatase activity